MVARPLEASLLMCRMSAVAATALALSLATQPALAFGLRGKAEAAPQTPAKPDAPPADGRASADERRVAERLDPLARAAFWARESQIDPTDVEAGLSLSRALRDMGKPADAATAAERLLAVAPDNLDVLLEVARAHLARGEGFFAVAPAERAQALAPGDWRAPFLLAMAYEQSSRDAEALAAHRRAVQLSPNNAAVLSNLALFQAARGQTSEAEALLRHAVAQPDAGITTRQNLALILGLQGRIDEAEALARRDLPPQMVAANLAYLRAATSDAPAAGASRSWDAVSRGQ